MRRNTVQIIYVTYEGTSETRFDRDYYVSKHLPLVTEAWAQHGLVSVSALFPAMGTRGTIAMCECRFSDEAAISRCFAAPETEAVMADITRFTDVAPTRLHGRPI